MELAAQQTLLKEDFNNNINKWRIENLALDERALITSGRYDLLNLSQNKMSNFFIKKKFNQGFDFKVESVITKLPRADNYYEIDCSRAKELLEFAHKYGLKGVKYKSPLRGIPLIEKYQNAGVRFDFISDEKNFNWKYASEILNEEIKKNIKDIAYAFGFLWRKYWEGSTSVIYKDEYFGLIWGCDDNLNLFRFGIIPDRQLFHVTSLNSGHETTLINWTESETILSGNSPNKLTVTSVDGTLYFLINDKLVDQSNLQPFYGYNIGFSINPKTHISVDNLIITGYESFTPSSKISGNYKGSGSGLIISEKGYVVTNYHVIDGATEIWIEINRDGIRKELNARVVIQDRNNDLAILKVDNEGFPNPTYGFNTVTSDVGTSVFSMGYPLLSVLGDEIKVTDGIISSKSGYKGDNSTYQISAPIQPGNSGGPLFNKKGYLVGITNSGIPLAENIGYAIKVTHLQNLIKLLDDKVILPRISKLENLTFTDQIKQLSKFVTIVKTK
jgi:S1-C subfamily serine protease